MNRLQLALVAALITTPASAIYPYGRIQPVAGASHGTFTDSVAHAATWTVPGGVTSITAQCWGGGGGGNSSTFGGAGGGFGGTSALTVTPGATVYYTVGAGGTSGNAGGTSWINTSANSQPANSSSSTIGCAASGGLSNLAPTGGTGLAYNSSKIFSGGSNGSSASGGGGGAGSTGNGNSPSGATGGNGGTPDGGKGGNSGANNGVIPGGGGGSSGSGANGQIKITW